MKFIQAVVLAASLSALCGISASAKNLHEYYGKSWGCRMMSVGVPGYPACSACEAKDMHYDDVVGCVPKPGASSNKAYSPERDSLRDKLPAPTPRYTAPPDEKRRMTGAIAATLYSRGDNVWVKTGAARAGTKSEAEAMALAECSSTGAPNCKVVGTWNSGCGYITQGTKERKVTWASGESRAEATRKCESDGYKCSPPIGFCVD